MRAHPRARFPTLFLSLRKWIALELAVTGLGVPGYLVVRFADELAWTQLRFRFGGSVSIAGRGARLSPIDIEPVLEIPLADFVTVLDA